MNHKKMLTTIISVLTLCLAIAFPSSAIAQTSDATFSFNPDGSSLTANTSQTIDIRVNTGSNAVSNFVAAIDVTGSAPSDLSVTATPPSGMETDTAQVVDVTGGKQVQLAIRSSSASSPYDSNGQDVNVATLSFTSPASGQMQLSFDMSISGIYSQGQNVLVDPGTTNYTFESACTTTAPTVGSLSPNSGASYEEGQTVNLSASSINYGENCGNGSNSASLRYRAQGTSSWTTCDSGTGTSLSCALTPSPNTYEWNAVVSNGAENLTTTTRTFTVNQAQVEDANLTFHVRLQAITTNAPGQDVTVTFKQNTQPPSSVISSHTVSSSTGSHPSLESVYTGTVTGVSPGTYKVCFKAKAHLQACYYDVTLQSGDNTMSFVEGSYDGDELLSGDVVNDNIIQLNDITEILSVYNQDERFRYDASGPTDPKDVNHDGFIDIEDISLSIVNYTNLQIPGDE